MESLISTRSLSKSVTVECSELYDKEKVCLLLEEYGDKIAEEQKAILYQMLFTPKDEIKRIYSPSEYGYGRLWLRNADKQGGLAFLERKARNTLAEDYYFDIDFENCAPSILYQLCQKLGIKAEILGDYVDNRTEILKDFMECYKCDRTTAKQLFTSLMFLGSYKTWEKKNNIKIHQDNIEFIEDFEEEMKMISETLYNCDQFKTFAQEYEEYKKKKYISKLEEYKAGKTKEKPREPIFWASFISNVVFSIENRLLTHLCDFFVANNEVPETRMFDGVFIRRFGRRKLPNTLLTSASNYIFVKSGYRINVNCKPMDEVYKFTKKPICEDNEIIDVFDERYCPPWVDVKPIIKHRTKFKVDEGIAPYTQCEEFLTERKKKIRIQENSVTIIQSNMNTGKSTAMIDYVNRNKDKNICFFTFRRSLASQQKRQLQDAGVRSYREFKNQQKIKCDKILISPESLHKLEFSNKGKPIYDILIIDEIDSVLTQFIGETTAKQLPGKSMAIFKWLLKNTPAVICMSGTTRKLDRDFLKNVTDKPIRCFINTHKPYLGQTVELLTYENQMKKKIFDALETNKKICVATSSKTLCNELKMEVAQRFGASKSLVYTADNHDSALFDVNKEWEKADIVVYSPTISAGVDCSLPFDIVVGYFNGSTPARENAQMFFRCRNAKERCFYVKKGDVYHLPTNPKEIKTAFEANITEITGNAGKTLNFNIDESGNFNVFKEQEAEFELIINSIAEHNRDKKMLRTNFSILMENMGFEVIRKTIREDDRQEINAEMKEFNKELKQIKHELKDIQVNNILTASEIPRKEYERLEKISQNEFLSQRDLYRKAKFELADFYDIPIQALTDPENRNLIKLLTSDKKNKDIFTFVSALQNPDQRKERETDEFIHRVKNEEMIQLFHDKHIYEKVHYIKQLNKFITETEYKKDDFYKLLKEKVKPAFNDKLEHLSNMIYGKNKFYSLKIDKKWSEETKKQKIEEHEKKQLKIFYTLISKLALFADINIRTVGGKNLKIQIQHKYKPFISAIQELRKKKYAESPYFTPCFCSFEKCDCANSQIQTFQTLKALQCEA